MNLFTISKKIDGEAPRSKRQSAAASGNSPCIGFLTLPLRAMKQRILTFQVQQTGLNYGND